MSNSPTFGGTITGGIQDISALLPLLGTDQCEKHIGSALDGGFLYSAVTPLSIFGSLGIVRASVSILVASLNIPRYQFMGAKLLYYSGFDLSGTVAPMIALDPKHPDRYLAETKLEEMVAEEHIVNVPGLTMSWPEGTVRWNLMLVASTLLVSLASLLPYISLILDSGDARPKLFFPLGFGFPILRVFGSAICVIVAQFLIQLRITILMKTRLLFISIDQLAKLDKVHNLSSQIDVGLKRGNADNVWTSEVAAERNIWALQKWLSTMPNTEEGSSYQALYTSEYAQHFGAINTLLHSWVPAFLCFSLAIGCISTVIGYIGCFFLVQHSTAPKGPLLWLILESILSLLRIFVWALNPSWDDSKGVTFKLRLFASPSLLICNVTLEDMRRGTLTYIAESDASLKDIVAYAGLRPTFSVQGVEFFYIVTIDSRNNPSGRLLMVISTEKQQRSSLLFKEGVNSPVIILRCTLAAISNTSMLALTIDNQSQNNNNLLTPNSVFRGELEAHYDEINSRLHNRDTKEEEQKAIFSNTWAMERLLIETTNHNQQPTEAHIQPPVWTGGEKACFDCFATQRRLFLVHTEMDDWITNQIAVYDSWIAHFPASTIFAPTDQAGIRNKMVSLLEQYEAIEKVHLLIECRRCLEQFLICVHAKWTKDIRSIYANAVEANLKPLYGGPDESVTGIGRTRDRQRNTIYEHRLEAKLLAERDAFLQGDGHEQLEGVRNRFNTMGRQLVDQWGVNHNNNINVGISHQLDAFREDIWRYCTKPLSTLNSSPDFADIFRLPSDLAANFSETVSVLNQSRMLFKLQKTRFFEEMEQRFASYPLNLDNKAKAVIDEVRGECRMMADQLFEMLRFSDRIDLKDIIDSPGLPSPSELRGVLINVNRECEEKVQQVPEGFVRMDAESERERVVQNTILQRVEELTRMSAKSKGKRVGQTKITQYFAKQSAH